MIFKELGNTGIIIPAIGQGANIGPFYEEALYERNIRYGIDSGLTFIDTSEAYMNGISETIIGNAIKSVRDNVILSTKVSSDNLRYDDIIKSAENSLKRLQVEVIDLYQIHWPNSSVDILDSMRAFDKLYKDGKIKNVGVSNFLPFEIDKTFHKKYSFGGIVSNQIEYNLYDRFAERYSIPYCREHNITVISYCPLNRGEHFKNKEISSLISNIANKYGKTISQIFLNWIVSHDGVIAIPFSNNTEHIKQNAEASDFVLDEVDFNLINDKIFGKIEHCNIKDIRVAKEVFTNSEVYLNRKEAVGNNLNFSPSPQDLADFLSDLTDKQIEMVKPIKVAISKNPNYKYDLIEGGIRYWSWVLAFGEEKEIPLYIIDSN